MLVSFDVPLMTAESATQRLPGCHFALLGKVAESLRPENRDRTEGPLPD